MVLSQGTLIFLRFFKYLKVLGIILSVPFLFLIYLILQILKRLAPNFMFNLITTKVLTQIKLTEWRNFSNLKSVEDLDFLFSVDIFKVIIFIFLNFNFN